jgi:hypothetical protein
MFFFLLVTISRETLARTISAPVTKEPDPFATQKPVNVEHYRLRVFSFLFFIYLLPRRTRGTH